ncbi:MAG: LysR family transcriptional regulator [Oscillospiraceae bacterium]
MTITQLQYYKTVCDNGNIKTASQLLHISQPAISNAIRDLEQELRLNLLVRTPKGTYPTEDGRTFLKYTNEFLSQFNRLSEIAKDISNSHNTLSCGVSPMVGSCVLPQIYNDFHSKYPEIDVNITTEKGLFPLYEMLEKNQLDVLLVPGLEVPASFEKYIIREERLMFCMHYSNPLALHKTLTPADIGNTPLVVLPHGHIQYELVHNLFGKYGITPNIFLRTNQLNVIRNFITAGTAGGFLYESYLAESADSDKVVTFDIGMPIIPFSLVWKKGGYLFTSARKFINSVKELAPSLNSELSGTVKTAPSPD